jgi:hypothetical protein
LTAMMKRRAPFIVRTGSRNPPKKKGPYNFCNYCGFETVYVDSFHAQYCNHCGAVEEIDAEKLKAQQEQERLQREVTYTIADGSPIYNPDAYSRTNIRHGRMFAMPGSGRTISMKDAVTDKLRYKDGRTKEMDQIFKAQDEQLTATGRTIISDKLELKRSANIRSSDELKAEKSSGTVGLSGTGRFNPTMMRRTRLSF